MFDTKMSIDGGVPSSSSQIFALSVRDVLAISLDVSFGQSEVKDEDLVRSLIQTYTEVIRFYITVNEVPIVDILDP